MFRASLSQGPTREVALHLSAGTSDNLRIYQKCTPREVCLDEPWVTLDLPPEDAAGNVDERALDEMAPLHLMKRWQIPAEEDVRVSPRLVESCPSYSFVEAAWFQMATGVIVLANAFITEAATNKDKWASMLYDFNQFVLCFYIFELFCRAKHYRRSLLHGTCRSTSWNVLDMLLVFFGIIDQWVLPFLMPRSTEQKHFVISVGFLFRRLRVLKLARPFFRDGFHMGARAIVPVFHGRGHSFQFYSDGHGG